MEIGYKEDFIGNDILLKYQA